MATYNGIVEDIDDPKKLGRVRIRIPALHGVEGSEPFIPTSGLPWVEPNTLSGYHYGSLIVPPKGTTVTVNETESGSQSPYRQYSGGSFGSGTPIQSKSQNDKKVPAKTLETPTEATKDYPNTKILFKDTSGAVVYVDGTGGIILNTGKVTVRLGGGTCRINSADTNIRVNTDSIIATDKNSKIEINGDKVITTNGVYTCTMSPDEYVVTVGTGEEGSGDSISISIKDDKITLNNTDQQLKVELGDSKITLENEAEEETVILGDSAIEAKIKSTFVKLEDTKINMDNATSKVSMESDNVKLDNGSCNILIHGGRIDLTGDTYVNGTPIP